MVILLCYLQVVRRSALFMLIHMFNTLHDDFVVLLAGGEEIGSIYVDPYV